MRHVAVLIFIIVLSLAGCATAKETSIRQYKAKISELEQMLQQKDEEMRSLKGKLDKGKNNSKTKSNNIYNPKKMGIK